VKGGEITVQAAAPKNERPDRFGGGGAYGGFDRGRGGYGGFNRFDSLVVSSFFSLSVSLVLSVFLFPVSSAPFSRRFV